MLHYLSHNFCCGLVKIAGSPKTCQTHPLLSLYLEKSQISNNIFPLKIPHHSPFLVFDRFLKKEKAINFSRNSLNNVLPSYYILRVSDMLCFLLKQHCSLQKTSSALCTDEKENNGKKTGRRPKIHQKRKEMLFIKTTFLSNSWISSFFYSK